ncbi:MAG: sigma-70 family RNA polymerase sigma factor [Bacillota bacterium]
MPVRKKPRAGGDLMPDHDLAAKIRAAQAGDTLAREHLIKTHQDFINAIASRFKGQSLDRYNDDEWSIALLAFNEAIECFQEQHGASFRSYATRVINHRLIDAARKEKRHRYQPLEVRNAEGELLPNPVETELSWQAFRETELVRERTEEIRAFEAELSAYGISFQNLAKTCPQHSDTRARLVQVASLIAADPALRRELKRTKRLPLQALCQATGLSRKVLKSGRRFIIALTILLAADEYVHLRDFFDLPSSGGEKG